MVLPILKIENRNRAASNSKTAIQPYTSRGCSSVVERLLPKQDIVGSSPITRSKWVRPRQTPSYHLDMAVFYVSSNSNSTEMDSCLPSPHRASHRTHEDVRPHRAGLQDLAGHADRLDACRNWIQLVLVFHREKASSHQFLKLAHR